jgi:hypothetical protein
MNPIIFEPLKQKEAFLSLEQLSFYDKIVQLVKLFGVVVL